MLAAHVFNLLTELFFAPDVDLFASRLNCRMTPFVSWRPDPDAMATDAFCLDWERFRSYIFPPFCLIGKILRKLSNDQAQAILVFPLWKTQSWYPKLMSMLVDYPVILPPVNRILLLPSCNSQHPLSHHLTLAACHVSGNGYASEAFHRKLPTSSSSHGGCQLKNATIQPSGNGDVSVVRGKAIHFVRM